MISDLNAIAKENKELYSELMEYVTTIPMLERLINPKRKKAKDLKRDKYKKIVVDLTNPHILEDMDYFRPAALSFIKTGKYCPYYKSRNPNSPYKIFWDTEIERCKKGYVRESDGEWISGYNYFYWNYSPIMKTEILGDRNKDGMVRADRISGFPDVWDGDYLFYHYIEQAEIKGKHAGVLKARGKGYSFKAQSMLNRNFFLYRESNSFALAGESEYLDSDGILTKADANFSFINQHAGFAKTLALKDTLMHRISGFKKRGNSTEFGFQSHRIGVTLKNKPDKARGKRGKIIVWEEAGSFPHLIKSWRIAQKSMEDGKRVFGLMVAFGTGGEEGVSFEGLERLFYSSKAYNVHHILNIYDKNSEKSDCAYFVPDYMNRADCYDKNGNSDVIKAMKEIIERRLIIKYNSTDSTDYAQVKAEEPITPQEAVMRVHGNEFPVNELKDYIAEIEPNKESFVGKHYIVDLIRTGHNTVTWKPNFIDQPLREHSYKGKNMQGSVELFELPQVTKGTGQVPRGRYIGGADTVDDDTNKTEGISLFSVWIFDLWQDVIVAEWTGRFQRSNDNFERALKLAILYNAEINYENKLKGMFAYFSSKNMLRYLMDTPEVLKDMDYIKDNRLTGNRAKGTPPSQQINTWARKEQANWMLTPNVQRDNIIGYKTIRSLGYIKECISWNLDGNFDRVSGNNMIFVARADRLKLTEKQRNQEEEEINEWDNDPFFQSNYNEGTLIQTSLNTLNF